MSDHSNIVPLRKTSMIGDPLTDILRNGARQLPAQAVKMEAREPGLRLAGKILRKASPKAFLDALWLRLMLCRPFTLKVF